MQVVFIILICLVVVGAGLYVHHRLTTSSMDKDLLKEGEEKEDTVKEDSFCCGLHTVCEKTSLSPLFPEEIVYFDDEELDIYKDKTASEYNDMDIEKFRDVLLTLQPEEIPLWARSIQQRNIVLPEIIREELIILVNERR